MKEGQTKEIKTGESEDRREMEEKKAKKAGDRRKIGDLGRETGGREKM